MGEYTKIPQSTFDELQMDAGVLLSSFDPANPSAPDAAIITATTGGITVSAKPTYSDMGADVDNCPNNTKELKHLDGWEVSMGFTALGTSVDKIKLFLGSAEVSGNKITPRRNLLQTDFKDLWWVGDRTDGGLVAVKILNALSTDGFSIKTSKNGKGNISVTITGHVSINAQDVVPIEFYSITGETAPVSIYLSQSSAVIADGDTLALTATATDGATIAWSSSDTSVATVSNGTVTAEAEGVCVIMAKATKSGESDIATCVVTVTEAPEAEGEG